MSSIKGHLDAILKETDELQQEHTTEWDEFVAVEEIRLAVNKVELTIHEARVVFERTKRTDKE